MNIVCLGTDKGHEPLAWTEDDVSVRELRKVFKKFKPDGDVKYAIVLGYTRFYDTKSEAKISLPEFK